MVIATIVGVWWMRNRTASTQQRASVPAAGGRSGEVGSAGGLQTQISSVPFSGSSVTTTTAPPDTRDPATVLVYPGGSRGGIGEEKLTTLAELQGIRRSLPNPLLDDRVSISEPRAGSAGGVAVPQGAPGGQDSDGDGLTTDQELQWGTDPKVADTDGDGLVDGDEARTRHTDPLKPDSDEDGLTDGQELVTHHTDPLNPDSDSDGYKDGDEVRNGYNPRGTGKR